MQKRSNFAITGVKKLGVLSQSSVLVIWKKSHLLDVELTFGHRQTDFTFNQAGFDLLEEFLDDVRSAKHNGLPDMFCSLVQHVFAPNDKQSTPGDFFEADTSTQAQQQQY